MTTESAKSLIFVLGGLGVLAGIAFVMAGRWVPAHKARLERWGGALVLAGVAVVGFAFPIA